MIAKYFIRVCVLVAVVLAKTLYLEPIFFPMNKRFFFCFVLFFFFFWEGGGGWECRDGAVVRALASHQCGLGSIPRLGIICELSLLVLYSERFSPGTPGFASPKKTKFDLH